MRGTSITITFSTYQNRKKKVVVEYGEHKNMIMKVET